MKGENNSSEEIADYYTYLFTFPSRYALILFIFSLNALACAFGFTYAQGSGSLTSGLGFGILGLALPMVVSDIFLEPLFHNEVIITPRRLNILSFTSSLVNTLAVIVSFINGVVTCRVPVEIALILSFSVSVGLRYLVFFVFSEKRSGINLLAVLSQPLLLLLILASSTPVDGSDIIKGLLTQIVFLAGAQLILFQVASWKHQEDPVNLIPLFRSFVQAWAEDHNSPLEDELARMGERQDVEVEFLEFSGDGGCLGCLLVPYIHPGPFRDLGSSALPKLLTEGLMDSKGCEVAVAHGVSGHDLDLARKEDAIRLLDRLINSRPREAAARACTPMVREVVRGASASCQIFGNTAVVALTLAPRSHEDLPYQLKESVKQMACERGLKALVIDSHNSLGEFDETEEVDFKNLVEAAGRAINRSSAYPKLRFSLGFSRVLPSEWGPEDGLGSCGIAALTVILSDGTENAYIVFDGNNMVKGLRASILETAEKIGYQCCEVLTTDTHQVNALGVFDRGYLPVGEVMDEEDVLRYVGTLLVSASKKAVPSEAYHMKITMEDVPVLGTSGLSLLREVLESGFSLFIRWLIGVGAASFIFSVLIFLF